MLKKLFSGLFGSAERAGQSTGPAPAEPVEYRGYRIISRPVVEDGRFRVSGVIQLPREEGEALEHGFERSDVLPDREACDAMMVSKAQRFIDETGEAMFGPDSRRDATDDQ
ncbi:HlyU family transcriptional regulator [Halomonas piscis]|uniref:HlyU family transcriptional regulator n=1 Tax=Halomonas piscis TaxID=3031727 RepID=A0ABY9YX11_9GAMM|nr:HlyU family transcriptional regulator [Halomonas piscis]WNK19011.1 HlyU family transcriptional regulator [Halomonas piscis]